MKKNSKTTRFFSIRFVTAIVLIFSNIHLSCRLHAEELPNDPPFYEMNSEAVVPETEETPETEEATETPETVETPETANLPETADLPEIADVIEAEPEPMLMSGAVYAEVGSFSELKSAITNAPSGGVIKITSDIPLTAALSFGKSLTFIADTEVSLLTTANTRHITISATTDSVELTFYNVALDGNSIGGGITTSADYLTLNDAVIKNCVLSGSGVGINVGAGKELTVNNGILSNNKSTSTTTNSGGGGIYGNANSKITVNGGEISNNTVGSGSSSVHGGGIYLNAGNSRSSELIINGAKIQDNEAAANGGGIYASTSSAYPSIINISDSEITGNTSHISGIAQSLGAGGGIFNGSYCQTTLTDCIISGNEAGSKYYSVGGGGIYTAANSSLNIIGGVISKNICGYGGGIMTTQGSVTDINGTLIGGYDDDEGNIAKTNVGGGIYVMPSSAADARLIMNDVVIINNTAATQGGGIGSTGNSASAMKHNFTLTNVEFINNSSGNRGGGVSLYGEGDIALINCDFKGNSAADSGGAIYCYGDRTAALRLSIDGGEISNNSVVSGNGGGMVFTNYSNASIANCKINGNSAAGYGGGIHIGTSAASTSGWTAYSTLDIDKCEFFENTAANGGGISGISEYTNSSTPYNLSCLINIKGSEFYDNHAETNGGAIYGIAAGLSNSGSAPLLATAITLDGSKVYENTAVDGGGVYITGRYLTVPADQAAAENAATAHKCAINLMNGSVITRNTASSNGGGINATVVGGGLSRVSFATVTAEDSEISYNEAKSGDGGGIFGSALAVIGLHGNTSVNNNTAAGSGGGIYGGGNTVYSGIYKDKPTIKVADDVSIYDNNAGKDGGGIFSLSDATYRGEVTVSGEAVISGNTAAGDGGGIYAKTTRSSSSKVNGSASVLDGAAVINNQAGLNGGGIFSSSGNITGTISENTAGANGGGIYGIYTPANADTVKAFITVSGSGTVSKNKALSGNGGGIYGVFTRLSDNASISDNTAAISGGGVYCVSNGSSGKGEAAISDKAVIRGNTAESGGGVFGDANAVVNISGGGITGNKADNGGGIFGTTINVTNTAEIRGNTASIDGGGVYITALKNFIADNLTFSGNTASVGYLWPLSADNDSKTHAANIKNTVYTSPFTNAYNNYDVNYKKVGYEYTPPPLYEIVINYYNNSTSGALLGTKTFQASQGDILLTAIMNELGEGWINLYRPEGYGGGIAESELPESVLSDVVISVVYRRSTAQLYTVTYVSEKSTGGSVPVDSAGYANGSAFTVLGNTNGLVRGRYYSFAGWKDMEGASYAVGGSYSLDGKDITLYAVWSLEAPDIDNISPGDDKITGKGEPGAKIEVTFPGGETVTTTVDDNGEWSVDIPDGVTLTPGGEVTAKQIDEDGLTSDPSTGIVSGGQANNGDGTKPPSPGGTTAPSIETVTPAEDIPTEGLFAPPETETTLPGIFDESVVWETMPEDPPVHQIAQSGEWLIDNNEMPAGQGGWTNYPDSVSPQSLPQEDAAFEAVDPDGSPIGLWSNNGDDEWSYEEYPPNRGFDWRVILLCSLIALAGLLWFLYFFLIARRHITREEFVRLLIKAVRLEAETENIIPYDDISENTVYYKAVMKAKAVGLLSGFPGNEFKPEKAITREEIASILSETVRYSNVPIAFKQLDIAEIFKDFSKINERFYDGIQLVTQLNIMQASNGRFDPNGLSYRDQAEKYINNLLGSISPRV